MAVRWRYLSGNTTRFAVGLSLLADPDEGVGATPEESLSWGAVEIWVRGRNVCAHVEAGETFTAVHWYLLELIEWFAKEWEPLFHEERLPGRNAGATASEALAATLTAPLTASARDAAELEEQSHSWRDRHSSFVARDGGLIPSLAFRRYRDKVELSWDEPRFAGVPDGVTFADPRGTERLAITDVAVPLYEVLTHVVEQLRTGLPQSDRLVALERDVGAIATEDRTESRVAWVAGLGSSAQEVAARWRSIRERASAVGGSARSDLFALASQRGLVLEEAPLPALLFGAVSPAVGTGDVDALVALMIRDWHVGEDSDELRKLTRPLAISDPVRPGEEGHELALEVLEALALDQTETSIDVESFFVRFGVLIRSLALEDSSIRAVTLARSGYRPVTVINTSHRGSSRSDMRRFTLAHELCHVLFDRDAGARLAVASGPWAPRDVERRAGGFAAMLLMPPSLIAVARARATQAITTRTGIKEMAHFMNTSVSATIEHLWNLRLLDEAEHEALVDEFGLDVARRR